MNTNPLSFSINAISNIVKTLTKKNYKQQLSETQRLINNIGFECERHLYRFLFEAILSTPQTDTNKLNLFQQLFSDLGNLFDKANFVSILQFALQYDQSSVDLVDDRELAQRISDLSKCLKLSELQKLSIFVCLNFLDFDKQVDLKKCKFQSDLQLTHLLLSKLLVCSDQPNVAELLDQIRKELQIDSQEQDLSSYLIDSYILNESNMEGNLPANASSSLNDDQIAAMLINENSFQLNSEIIKQFNVTPKLCAKLLFALCDSRTENVQNSNRTQNEEIELLANVCREYLSGGSPLSEIIQAIDSEAFLNVNTKIINSKTLGGKISVSFQMFWQFCINLCNTDKQGVSLLGILFFNKVWNHNIEFQFNFILSSSKVNYLVNY